MMRHLDLFSGIGGFALAARMVGGIRTTQFVEKEAYCQKVLNKNFPGVPIHDDITTFFTCRGAFDLITGGFPCQDISCANANGRGLEGERSGLFYELMRVVRECRPRYVLLENVAAMLTKQSGRIMGAVLWELSESGYDAEWQVVSAASMGAPHLRERVFIVAYPQRPEWRAGVAEGCHLEGENSLQERSKSSGRSKQLPEAAADSSREGLEEREGSEFGSGSRAAALGCPGWSSEPGILRVVNGLSNRVDRTKGLGNAVLPQCAALPLMRILQLESEFRVSKDQ